MLCQILVIVLIEFILYPQVVSDLLAHGSNPDLYDNEGWIGMHFAACEGHEDVIKLLAANKGQVDQQNKYGRTPLHWACSKSQLGAVETLLSLGADLTIKDRLDKKPTDVASDPTVIEILKLYEANLPKDDDEEGGPIITGLDLQMALKPFVRHVSRVESLNTMEMDAVSVASSDSSVMSPNYENALKAMFGPDILNLINDCFRLQSGVGADERRAARHKYKQFLVAVGSLLSITSKQADNLYNTVASALQHKSNVADVLKVVFEKLQVVEDNLADFQREISAEVRTLTANFGNVIRECAEPTPNLSIDVMSVESRSTLLRQGRFLSQIANKISKHHDLWKELVPQLHPDLTLDSITELVERLEFGYASEEEQVCELLIGWSAQRLGEGELDTDALLMALEEVGSTVLQEEVKALVNNHHISNPLHVRLGSESPSSTKATSTSALSVQTHLNDSFSEC